jgi:SAM-dependent methyltransferase
VPAVPVSLRGLPPSRLRIGRLACERVDTIPRVEPPPIADEILVHYTEEVDEGARLTRGMNELELVRVRAVVRQHLDAPPLKIIDIGGATGVHARWLAEDGHRVHLVDAVRRRVDAVDHLATAGFAVTAELGDARSLTAADATFDAALLFGPMYHLTERAERVRALEEAARVVVPGGPVFIAAISRFASLLSGLAYEFLFDTGFRAIVERDLHDGQHRNPTHRPEWFTVAYFHDPEDLLDEVRASGLAPVEVLGVEGPAAWLPQLASRWREPAGREAILFAAEATQHQPAFSPHLIAVAHRPR